ncbi:MAG: LamG domain-containing protein, partial [Planctomycetes bacterium]|nr:LamG domain-containing protein [Planctomycetota bacterium]
AGKPLVIPRGEKLSDGRYKSLDARQGTLEFWFRAEWPRDDISDHTIASCGQMRLYRRSSLGTYLGLGGTRQSGFITEPGRWYHLAITWDAGGPGREPKTGLFINGLDLTGQMLSAAKEPLGDWTADKLILGGDVAFTIDDLRISDVVRYEKDSPIPAALSTDPHTLLLNPF